MYQPNSNNSLSILSFFTSQAFQEALVEPVSFPDVKGALPPTVAATFVDAATAIWRVKIPALAHKTFSTDI